MGTLYPAPASKEYRDTLLIGAVTKNDTTGAQAIIKTGAAVINERDTDGNTPLIVASRYGQTNMADLLINNGANLSARNNDGVSAIDYALMYDHKDVAQLLVNKIGSNLDVRNRDHYKVLHDMPIDATRDLADVLRCAERVAAGRPFSGADAATSQATKPAPL